MPVGKQVAGGKLACRWVRALILHTCHRKLRFCDTLEAMPNIQMLKSRRFNVFTRMPVVWGSMPSVNLSIVLKMFFEQGDHYRISPVHELE